MPPSATFPPGYLEANKGSQVLAIIIVFPSLAAIAVFLRLYTRLRIVNNASYEDLAILLALIFSVATSICQGFQVYNGMGRHIQTLTLQQGIGSLKALFASIMMYNFGLSLVKVSICLQYLRITVDKHVRRGIWALFWLTIANCIQTFLTGIFSCFPVPKFWDDRIPGGCVNKPGLWYANAGINIVQDIWLIVLPIFILRKVQMQRREKISLICILGLGGFAGLASVLRIHALYIVANSQDITWDNPGTATWSAMELNIGIICASLPTLRALLAKYFPRVFHSTIRSRGYQPHRTDDSNVTRNLVRQRDDLESAFDGIIVTTDVLQTHTERKDSHTSDSSQLQAPGAVHTLEEPKSLAIYPRQL